MVLRQYFRWYPIEGVLDAVVVWPAVDIANKEQLVHGMEDVFVIFEEENTGNWCWPCKPIDADNWATLMEFVLCRPNLRGRHSTIFERFGQPESVPLESAWLPYPCISLTCFLLF